MNYPITISIFRNRKFEVAYFIYIENGYFILQQEGTVNRRTPKEIYANEGQRMDWAIDTIFQELFPNISAGDYAIMSTEILSKLEAGINQVTISENENGIFQD